jgi:heat shock protein HslJ
MRIILLAAALALAACAHAPEAAAPAATDSLAGTNWVLASRALEPPTLSFTDEGAAGFAGCNRWFGTFTQDADGARFSGVGSTRMMCPEPAMNIERNFLSQLERTRAVRVDGRTLTLLDEAGAEIGALLRTD